MREKSDNVLAALGLIFVAGWLAFVGGIGYIAFHFVAKFW